MSFDPETIYNLLPAVHRIRDAEQGNPLRQLVEVIAGQVAVLEEEMEQLYDNHFVETAAPWALPYLGDLLGIRGLPSQAMARSPRAEVGHTIAYRRRKGTAAVLEQLARDATGWPAAAVEFFQRLATTQHLNHIRPHNRSWLSLRHADRLELIDTPFEDAARTVEVRRIRPGLGKWNIPNVAVFVWRHQAYSRTRSPLAPAHFLGERHFRFHPLGLDVPLCLNPITETDISHLAQPENVPWLLTRRFLAAARLTEADQVVEPAQFHPDTRIYGSHSESSLLIEVSGASPDDAPMPVPAHKILVCDLHDVPDPDNPSTIIRWGHDETNDANAAPKFSGMILLDPQRGRIVFPEPPTGDPLATFYGLFPADLGGGEYARAGSFSRGALATRAVSQQQPPQLDQGDTRVAQAITNSSDGNQIIEILDSGHYVETVPPLTANDRSLELRGADGSWPVLTLREPLLIEGNSEGSITLNGLLITGGGSAPPPPIRVAGQLGALHIRHCTLLPRLAIHANGQLDTAAPRQPALTIEAPNCAITIEDSILGPLHVPPDSRVFLKRCIVDAGFKDQPALGGILSTGAGLWTIENCTIIGNVAAGLIELASNTIFHSLSVTAERRQEGCVRFCWLPANARVPRAHRCLPRNEIDSRTGADLRAVRPHFTSLRYGHPAYGQLGFLCPESIRRGAADEAAMGAYHDLFQPQREAHARTRLEEYLPFGLEIGLLHAGQSSD